MTASRVASSVTLDGEMLCSRGEVSGYNAVHTKIVTDSKYRWSGGRDYAILQLRGRPAAAADPDEEWRPRR